MTCAKMTLNILKTANFEKEFGEIAVTTICSQCSMGREQVKNMSDCSNSKWLKCKSTLTEGKADAFVWEGR